MPPRRITRKQLLQGCQEPGPEDGIDPRISQREDFCHASAGRKTLQLCAQVYRAIELAVSGHHDALFRDMMVASVVPAPGKGRLLVTLQRSPSALERPLEQWLEALVRLAPQARFVTAQAIHRRKTPELVLRWQQTA